jgi:hypothetical protein
MFYIHIIYSKTSQIQTYTEQTFVQISESLNYKTATEKCSKRTCVLEVQIYFETQIQYHEKNLHFMKCKNLISLKYMLGHNSVNIKAIMCKTKTVVKIITSYEVVNSNEVSLYAATACCLKQWAMVCGL